jgi:hypothetical protein
MRVRRVVTTPHRKKRKACYRASELERLRNGKWIKPEGKRPLGRPTRTWEDNIRLDLREIVGKGVNWMHLAQDTDHENESSGSIKGGEFLD